MCARINWIKISQFIYSENHSTAIPHTYTSQQSSAVWDYIIGKWDWWKNVALLKTVGTLTRCTLLLIHWYIKIGFDSLSSWTPWKTLQMTHYDRKASCRMNHSQISHMVGDYWLWGILMTLCHIWEINWPNIHYGITNQCSNVLDNIKLVAWYFHLVNVSWWHCTKEMTSHASILWSIHNFLKVLFFCIDSLTVTKKNVDLDWMAPPYFLLYHLEKFIVINFH